MSEDNTYDITLRSDEQQHLTIAKVTGLPGVVGKGHTREEAIAAVKEAIRWQAEAATEGHHPTVSPGETYAQDSH